VVDLEKMNTERFRIVKAAEESFIREAKKLKGEEPEGEVEEKADVVLDEKVLEKEAILEELEDDPDVELVGDERFLTGVRSLSSYADIEKKQLRGLLVALDKCQKLSTAQGAAFLEAVDHTLWSSSSLEELRLRVAEKTMQVEEASARRTLQDFSQLYLFLTEELAAAILTGSMNNDQLLCALCQHAARLSLRSPSEPTIAVMVTLANWQKIQQGISDKAKFMLLHQQKPVLKRYLLAAGDAPTALAALPTDFRQLPDKLRQDSFGDGAPADLTAHAVAFLQAAKSMPLRGTNRAIAASSAVRQDTHEEETSDWTARMVSAAVRGAMAATRVPDASMNASVRPTDMLAIMDAPRGDREDVSVAEVAAPVSTGPGDSLAAPPRTATAAVPLDVSMMKRPAAAIASTGCDGKKAKAGKAAERQESKKAKSKAKPKAQTATKPKGQMSREERRRAILAVVPKAMQQRYKDGVCMTRKEVKEEESSDEYTYVTTEGEEEPAAEAPTRAERERGRSAAPVRTAGATSAPSMPEPPTSPPPPKPAATGCDREPSEESDRAPRARPPRSPFSPGGNDKEETHGRRRRRHARRAQEQDVAEPSGTAAPGAETQKGKGKRRRQKAPDARQCPICRAPVGNHESSLSQHQYWNEDCNARRIWNEQYCTWTAARRQALQLKEEREDAYYNRGVPVTPAPSLAVRNKIEGREDGGKEEEEDKEPEHGGKKKKEKSKRKRRRHHRRHSPSPDVPRDRRRSKRPPSDDEDEDLPKVRRGPGGSFILQFTPKVS
ncbi:unnamed protein product, partial [Cladocopium goreaui]